MNRGSGSDVQSQEKSLGKGLPTHVLSRLSTDTTHSHKNDEGWGGDRSREYRSTTRPRKVPRLTGSSDSIVASDKEVP